VKGLEFIVLEALGTLNLEDQDFGSLLGHRSVELAPAASLGLTAVWIVL
jgi:hypothetical protein